MRSVVSVVLLLGSLPAMAESLNYTISWASGLNLGEATLRSESKANAWNFGGDLDVSVPGFAIRDKYTSSASDKFCSIQLEKTTARGSRKSEEHVTFDQETQRVTRQTKGGGQSESNVPACARDPFTFLQFVRKELAEGRLAPQQSVVFGSTYQVRFEYTGVQHVQIGKQRMETERIQTTIKGPASEHSVEIFFARDATRTPVLARIPSPLGTFVVELTR
jgi:hypothetical protein